MTVGRPAATPQILFRVAAGRRIGFGHLVRGARLAEALGIAYRVSLRGSDEAVAVARRLGASLECLVPAQLSRSSWDAVVVDDPHAASGRRWLRSARRQGLLSVSIHDLGLGAEGADIVVDGTLGAPHRCWAGGSWHVGPPFAILSRQLRTAARGGAGMAGRAGALISLGGGPRLQAMWQVVRELRRRNPSLRVQVAPGLTAVSAAWRARFRRLGAELVEPSSFVSSLRACAVAVLAGGVSLYEAAALGTPTVALAVVAGQRPTILAFRRAGLTCDGGRLFPGRTAAAARRVAGLVDRLLGDTARRRAMSRAGQRSVDARGAQRVAAIVRRELASRRAVGGGAARPPLTFSRPRRARAANASQRS